MTSRDRVLTALRGGAVDRPPISFWGHVYHRESSAAELVAHTLERQNQFHWDWIKLNPRKHYHVEDWGVRYTYPGVPNEKPVVADWPVKTDADWDRIQEIPHDQGALGEHLDAVRRLRAAIGPDVPVLATVFTPLAILAELTEPPQRVKELMDSDPARLARALEVVTRVFERHAAALIAAGADGLFLATVDWGCRAFVTPESLRRWSRPNDLRVLAAAGASPYHTLHVCKGDALLAEFADYPVGAFSWDTHLAGNWSLSEGLARLPGAVMGGIAHETTLQGADSEAVREQYRRALEETGARRWMVAPGCSIPPATPEANLAALRDEVDRIPAPGGRS